MDQFNSFMSGSALNTLVGTGDRSTLMMVLQAQSAILAGGGDFTPTPSPLVAAPVQTAEEQASSLATAKGQVSGSCSGNCTLKMMWYGCTLEDPGSGLHPDLDAYLLFFLFYPFAGLKKQSLD